MNAWDARHACSPRSRRPQLFGPGAGGDWAAWLPLLFIGAMLLGSLGVLGDLLAAQRTLSQRTLERVRRIELQLGVEPSHYEPGGTPKPGPGSEQPDREALEV